MILYKTYQGQTVSVLRDAVPTDEGYDNGPGSYQQLVQDASGHVFLVDKFMLSNSDQQQWPTVSTSSQEPEQWPA